MPIINVFREVEQSKLEVFPHSLHVAFIQGQSPVKML